MASSTDAKPNVSVFRILNKIFLSPGLADIFRHSAASDSLSQSTAGDYSNSAKLETLVDISIGLKS